MVCKADHHKYIKGIHFILNLKINTSKVEKHTSEMWLLQNNAIKYEYFTKLDEGPLNDECYTWSIHPPWTEWGALGWTTGFLGLAYFFS